MALRRKVSNLKTVEKEFIPLILGNDINAYSMARAFYEEYGIKSIVVGKYPSGPSCNSRIIDYYAVNGLDRQESFLATVNGFAEKFRDKKVILLGCGDSYVELIIKNKSNLNKNIVAPYIEENLMKDLLTKSKFYEMCDKYGLEYPKTFICSGKLADDFELPFSFPVILKPSNSISYWEHEFKGQKKVYRLTDMKQLKDTINSIYEAGYPDTLIIQEYVLGEDSELRVLITFSGKDKKVKLMALAHVLLEEHTPHGLGNTAILVNEYNKELCESIRLFLDSIGFEGFATFDIKYDRRDNKFKVLEINLRQGRSNYYVTGAGYNLAKYMVETYIYNSDMKFEIVNNENLWTVIPIGVAKKYLRSKELQSKLNELVSCGKVINPLMLKGDMGFKRALSIYKTHFSHYFKFKKYFDKDRLV